MGSRNYTRELRRAQEQGAKIVCSMAPYEGKPVTYSPREKGDPKPWIFRNPEENDWGYRYSGRECHAVVTVKTAHQNPASGETARYEIDVEPEGDFTPGRVSGVVRAVRPRTPNST